MIFSSWYAFLHTWWNCCRCTYSLWYWYDIISYYIEHFANNSRDTACDSSLLWTDVFHRISFLYLARSAVILIQPADGVLNADRDEVCNKRHRRTRCAFALLSSCRRFARVVYSHNSYRAIVDPSVFNIVIVIAWNHHSRYRSWCIKGEYLHFVFVMYHVDILSVCFKLP